MVRCAGTVADKPAIGSLEYAVENLGMGLLVVIGHQHCAGVEVACSGAKMTSPNVKAIVAAIRSALPPAYVGADADALPQAVKANTRNMARAVVERSEVLSRAVQRGELSVIAAYYDLGSGQLERL